MLYNYQDQANREQEMKNAKIEYTKSTGNIFEDLGFSDSKERLAKSQLAMKINDLIEKRDLTQKQSADILHVNQPKISALINGRLDGFSIERLMYFLNLLNQDVEIVVKPSKRSTRGRITVCVVDKKKAAG